MLRRSMNGPRKRNTEGLTLVEVAVVLSLAGIVLAIFVPTFFRELRSSKIAEASEQLLRLEQVTAAYFATTHRVEGRTRRYCLPEAAGPTPPVGSVDPIDFDFHAEDVEGRETWIALGFDPGPGRYRYTIVPERAGCDIRSRASSPVVTFRAEGDLDGDGRYSVFERRAAVRPDRTLRAVGALTVRDRVE